MAMLFLTRQKLIAQNGLLLLANIFFYSYVQHEQIAHSFYRLSHAFFTADLLTVFKQELYYNTIQKPLFVFYLFFVMLVGYYGARGMAATAVEKKRRFFLVISIILAAAFLFIIKYSGFIADTVHLLSGRVSAYHSLHMIVFMGTV